MSRIYVTVYWKQPGERMCRAEGYDVTVVRDGNVVRIYGNFGSKYRHKEVSVDMSPPDTTAPRQLMPDALVIVANGTGHSLFTSLRDMYTYFRKNNVTLLHNICNNAVRHVEKSHTDSTICT